MSLTSVIIVNWNAGRFLRACVESLARFTEDEWECIIVDNGSTDGSTESVEGMPHVRIIRNSTNAGFAAACNQGACASRGEYLLFLNPDCELQSDAISACREAMEADPRMAVASVRLVDESGKTWRTCQRFPNLVTMISILSGAGRLIPFVPRNHTMSDWAHDEDRDVDNVIGAFYFVRKELFDRVLGFDERFFVYWEDVDLSKRLVDLGFKVRFLHLPSVFHAGGGTTNRVKALRTFLTTRSRIQYCFKHLGTAQATLHLFLSLTVEPICRVVERVATGRSDDVDDVLRAAGMLYQDLPILLESLKPGSGRRWVPYPIARG